MRRIALMFFIVTLVGCKSTNGAGPFSASRQKDKTPDPLLTGDDKRNSNRESLPDAGSQWYLPPQNLNGTAANR